MTETPLVVISGLAFLLTLYFLKLDLYFKWFHLAVFASYSVYFLYHIILPDPGDSRWYDFYFCFVALSHLLILLIYKFFEWIYRMFDK